jgi:hypothetical protein
MMSEHDEKAPGIHWSYRVTQAIFAFAATICFVIFWCAGQMLGIPAEPGHGGSLVSQPTVGRAMAGLAAAAVLLVGCTLFSHAFLRRRWFMASLAAATAGFSAWSMRGGPSGDILRYAPSVAVFFRLALELIFLGATVGAVWTFLWREEPGGKPAAPGESVAAVLQHTAIMGILLFLLVQTDAKKQCVISVFLAALISASIVRANWSRPEAGKWFWIAPILVGVIGYLLAAFQGGDWNSGMRELTGFAAPLARPLPLDYASVGMFGSLLGYWMNSPDEDMEESEDKQPGASPAGLGS